MHFVENEVLTSATDDCIFLPTQKRKAYPLLYANGKAQRANRYVCTMAHGEPEDPSLQAAHSCGDCRCINPRHLRWATTAENTDDKFLHGTVGRGVANGRAKLTDADVRKILSSTTKSQSALASEFGVGQSNISRIRRGASWRHLRRDDQTIYNALHDRLSSQADADYQARKEAF